MKVILTNRGRAIEQLEPALLKKFAQEQQGPPVQEHLMALAQILQGQISSDMLAGLEIDQVYRWLQMATDFLDGRTEEVKVELRRIDDAGRHFLFCNTADANHIFSSIQEYLHRQSLQFRTVCHPIIPLRRQEGTLTELNAKSAAAVRESFVWILLERLPETLITTLKRDISNILTAALQIGCDRQATYEQIDRLRKVAGLARYNDLFDWMLDDNFIPVAYRAFLLNEQKLETSVNDRPETALGVAALYDQVFGHDLDPVNLLDVILSSRLMHGGDVALEKTEQRSPIHRFERLTYLGFREPLANGRVREHAFWGFYTQKSIDENTFSIPSLRQRIEKAQKALGIRKESHNYRKTVQIFNTFPKVELFLMGDAELRRMLRSFIQLHRQAGVKVVVAPSMSELGLTLLLIMPKEFYTPGHLQRIDSYLKRHFRADSVESRIIHLSVDYLSLHVNLRLRTPEVHIDLLRLEQGLTRLIQPWKLKFRHLLEKTFNDASGELWQRYHKVFRSDYRSRTHPRFAVRDMRNIEKLLQQTTDVFDIWGPFTEQGGLYRLQFYSQRASYLNDLMPFLENLNLCVIEEVDFTLKVDGRSVFIKSFAIRQDCTASLPMETLKPLLIEMLGALREGLTENDYLQRLLPLTGLDWQEIAMFRAYRNYYFQLGSPFTKRRSAFALINNHQVALLLFRYFEGRFLNKPEWADPLQRESLVLSPIRQQLLSALEQVSDSNEDQILRTLFNLIDSTVRSNFFVRRGRPDFFFSFKIGSLGVIDMPSPRPLYEVYVHSVAMEGIHLRGGKVARGGIRWSDRPDDFRTEVLGLMKTQMTKNAVIVPVGSKGGFIVKTPFSDREEGAVLASAAYQTLMRGLLDLTDNRTPEGIQRPAGIIAYDDEDPYLVVAADKGTAHLSDTANAISDEYGFWLGDAFASGGSHGYDHKKLGITARGAWVSVMRHFRELGHDTRSEPFSVIGIGDMSGDVFGNGMLLSRQIKLLAAFDHRHIFLDPDPDPQRSFVERERLFKLPRSSWEDYNVELISEGGGVYSRQSKEIPLSPQVRRWLGVRQSSLDVAGLIRLLLAAEADLFWNGGIGTYVRASFESDEEAGDRANDAVRIDATQLRVRVIGEGGNLGLTQQARIEYAQLGGCINTDAVDNSAGVDSSDHEVNLKIMLQVLRQQGELADLKEGYRLLDEMEETVCADVLDNNYGQTLALSLDTLRCEADVEPFLDLMDRLGRAGMLDRRDEFLPARKVVATRQPNRLLRPELSVLLAYSKMFFYRALLESDLPASAAAAHLLHDYFPEQMNERYGAYLQQHPLAKEITATMITNRIVDLAGSTFWLTLSRQTGSEPAEVARAYLVFDKLLNGPALRRAVFALDNCMPSQRQYQLLLKLEGLLGAFCRFALDQRMALPEEPAELADYAEQLERYAQLIPDVLSKKQRQDCRKFAEQLQAEGLDEELARRFAMLDHLNGFLPLAGLVRGTEYGLDQMLRLDRFVADTLQTAQLLACLESVPVRDSWDRRARESLIGSSRKVLLRLIQAVAAENLQTPEQYFRGRRQGFRAFADLRDRLLSEPPANFHPYTVILAALEALLQER
jgi:glutamate dehydrogenase